MKSTSDMTMTELAAEINRLRKQPAIPTGPRAVYVVDRGWIFAGDATETPSGYIRLDRAVWVFRWEAIGFARMIAEPNNKVVDIRSVEPVEIPKASVVFRVPVPDEWGVR